MFASQVNTSTDVSMSLVLLHPKSAGSVTLQSNSPVDKPLIDLNFLSEEEDLETFYKAIQFLQELNNTETFKSFGAKFIVLDSPGCTEYEYGTKDWWFCNFKYYCGQVIIIWLTSAETGKLLSHKCHFLNQYLKSPCISIKVMINDTYLLKSTIYGITG